MKHALLFAIFAVSAVAGIAQQPVATRSRLNTSSATAASLKRAPIVKDVDNAQGAIFKRVEQLEFVSSQLHYWPFGVSSNDIFVYDAKTNSLNIARNKALFPNGILSGTDLGVLRSTNNGSTWTMDVITTVTNVIGTPTLGFVNPNDVIDPAACPLTLFGMNYKVSGNRLLEDGSGLWSRGTSSSYDLKLSDQPPISGGYEYDRGDLYANNNNGNVHFAGMLDPTGSAQYGAYAQFSINLLVDDFDKYPSIPAAWALDKWKTGPAVGSTYNTPMLVEGDANGTLYACFNNITSSGDDKRSVQVCSSTDDGATWGAFNEMPSSLIEQFVAARGGDFTLQPDPYSGGDFIVTGPNEYSFFYRIGSALISVTDPTQLDTIFSYSIVEASFKAGTWSLTSVADLRDLNVNTYSLNDSITTAIGSFGVVESDNGRGHEIQAAKTVDGSMIIVKYIDVNPERQVSSFSQALRIFRYDRNGTLGELPPISQVFDTDIYIVTRPANASQWNERVNVSDDADMAYRTYMPKIVPNADNIPLLRILGTPWSATFPTAISQMSFNNGAAVDYANTGVVSVASEKTYTFRFGAIAPNPVTSSAEVSFTLDRSATVGIEVYDMLGSQLSSIPTQTMSAGIHGVNVDATAFAAGTYNVALVVDGVRIMKPFVVVR